MFLFCGPFGMVYFVGDSEPATAFRCPLTARLPTAVPVSPSLSLSVSPANPKSTRRRPALAYLAHGGVGSNSQASTTRDGAAPERRKKLRRRRPLDPSAHSVSHALPPSFPFNQALSDKPTSTQRWCRRCSPTSVLTPVFDTVIYLKTFE